MELSNYEFVPQAVEKEIAAKFQPKATDDEDNQEGVWSQWLRLSFCHVVLLMNLIGSILKFNLLSKNMYKIK